MKKGERTRLFLKDLSKPEAKQKIEEAFGSGPLGSAVLELAELVATSSPDNIRDVEMSADPSSFEGIHQFCLNVYAVASVLFGSVIVTINEGQLAETPGGDNWAVELLFGLFRYFTNKPYRVFIDLGTYNTKVSSGKTALCHIMRDEVYDAGRDDTDERKKAEEELTEARRRIALLKESEMRALVDSTQYVPVRERMLERGDTVYEVVQYGNNVEHIKYRTAKVVEVERNAASVQFLDDGRCVKVHFKRLVLDRGVWAKRFPKEAKRLEEQEAAALTTQVIKKEAVGAESMAKDHRNVSPIRPVSLAEQPARPESDFDTWLSLGKDFLDAIDKERAQLEANIADVSDRLTKLDVQHQRDIEAIEKELREAKERHRQERAVFVGRSESLKQKLESLERRRGLLEYVVKEGE